MRESSQKRSRQARRCQSLRPAQFPQVNTDQLYIRSILTNILKKFLSKTMSTVSFVGEILVVALQSVTYHSARPRANGRKKTIQLRIPFKRSSQK